MKVLVKRGGLLVVLLIVALMIWGGIWGYRFWQTVPRQQNVLILGKGGLGHTASDLTDTIIFATLTKNQSVKLVSLPRDIWVDKTKAKLNASYYWDKKYDTGYNLTTASIKEITGQDVDSVVVIDFSAFEKVIDAVGGIKVNVQKGFVDEKYPVVGKEDDLCSGDKTFACRYQTVAFEQGEKWMDGATALQFVRSRNASGDEGTDLARSARQQQVILAIKERVLSKEVLFSIQAWKKLYQLFLDSVENNFNNLEFQQLFGLVVSSKGKIESKEIPQEMLVVSQNNWKYDRQYVFLPKTGSWDSLHEWFVRL